MSRPYACGTSFATSFRPTSFEPIDARGAKAAGLLMVRFPLALAVSEE